MNRLAWLLSVTALAAAPLAAQNQDPSGKPVCGHMLQGYVRLDDGHMLRHGIVEEVVEPHLTVMLRTKTDLHGRFELPYGRRVRGSHVLLRISGTGVPTTLVKMKIDPSCGDPVITASGSTPGPGL